MAKIDVKFMKGNRALAKDMGSTYTKKRSKAAASGTKKSGKKK